MGYSINTVSNTPLLIDSSTYSYTNPVAVGVNGGVIVPGGVAIQLNGTVNWTIHNSGTIQSTGTGTASQGISLTLGTVSAGGVITNYASGLISGGEVGIYDAVAATVVNLGRISGTDGVAGFGVFMVGGTVVNGLGGIVEGGRAGVTLVSAAGVVSNAGTLTGTGGQGIALASGYVGNQATGTITGKLAGVSIAGASNVVNAGTIVSTDTVGPGYTFTSGFVPLVGGVIAGTGRVSNASSGTIIGSFIGVAQTGIGSVVNAGVISGTSTSTSPGALGIGVWLFGGGVVTNAAGGTIAGGFDGVLSSGTAASSISNDGMIQGRNGIDMFSPATAHNNASGTITAIYTGIYGRSGGTAFNAGTISAPFGILIENVAETATNSGTIVSAQQNRGAGIQLRAGGLVTNAAGGYISAKWIGIQIGAGASNGTNASAAGTVVNSGTVRAFDTATGSGAAVWIRGDGVILNNPGGTITGGPYGIVSYDQVTVVNYGSIGGSQFAVFASVAGKADRVVVHPGAQFSGEVQGDKSGVATVTGTLELAAGTLAGSIAGFGSKYTGFSSVIVDAGAHWSLGGAVASAQVLAFPGTGAGLTLVNPADMAGTITGFDPTETLTLGGITGVTGATLGANNLLTVTGIGGGTITLQFDPNQTFASSQFNFTTTSGGTDLLAPAPCFAAGTRLLTEHGPVAVEALRVGMRLRSAFGGTAPIAWIGHRRVDCARHARPEDVWPVRVRAGAVAPGVPAVDVLLSPDHALHIGGDAEDGAPNVLIPVRYLINGRTVVQERAAAVTYFHIEMPVHDVVFAEGLPAETYLDTGNRAAFANTPDAVMLHADFARAAWESGGCATLVLQGPELEAVKRRLLARAAALGARHTSLPGLRVVADGRVLPARIAGLRWQVAVPPGAARVQLLSRRWVPAHARAGETDLRQLGVALGGFALDGVALPLDDPRLAGGWHAPEPEWRWTDGDAAIATGGAGMLEFDLMLAGTYWEEAERVSAAAAAGPTRRR